MQLGDELFRPDVAGWRRERCLEPPRGRSVRLQPDWICEILSASLQVFDRVDKLQSYFAANVRHYWIVNPWAQIVEVYRHRNAGYQLALSAKAGQRIRAEPFDAVELRVDELFGADPEED